uniref:Ig-like domain-containing protein n=1 Tax=Anabas testudineus TaxID=64144 RepID=A0A7N6AUL7_ANATE
KGRNFNGKGEEIDDKPRFLIKPLSLRVDRGEDAAFSCKIWGTPLPQVTWEKDGKKLNDIFESSHFSVSNQDGGWFQLKIYRTRMPDKGVYTCKQSKMSSNGLTCSQWSPKHRGGRLSMPKVTEDPHVPHVNKTQVKKFAVAEGKHAKFRCFVTGKPKPEIIWKKDGVPLEPGRRHLIFEDREVQDTGLYVCAASNALGNTLSAVHLTSISTCTMQKKLKGLGLNSYVALRKPLVSKANQKKGLNLLGSIKFGLWSSRRR